MRQCLHFGCSLARPARAAATAAPRGRMGLGGLSAAAAPAAGLAGPPDGERQQAAAAPPAAAAAVQQEQQEQQFQILSEEVLHKRYLTLYNRRVQFPAADGQSEGPVLEFDIAGHPGCAFHFAVVFPYHSGDGGSVTLIREYAQGLNQMVYCLPTGGFEPRKHASYEACGRAELSEEARLRGGTWVPLLPEGHPGIPEIKWGRNRFHAFLVIDPEEDTAPAQRDKEEVSIEVVKVSLPELKRLMASGDMLLPSVSTCFWALEKLQELQQPAARQQGQEQQQGGAPPR